MIFLPETKGAPMMKLDEAIIEQLGLDGESTVKEISEGLSRRIQGALDRLVKDGKVIKSGHKGQGNRCR
jgi:hypothetical protein